MLTSGNIKKFAHLSEFTTVEQFNRSIQRALHVHGDSFTKGEKIAFKWLTRFSIKIIGVCNARICILVQACQQTSGGISRSTFQRMLTKAKSLGIISIIPTVRKKGGQSHNVYVFHPFDKANDTQLTKRKNGKNPLTRVDKGHKNTKETTLYKTNKIIYKKRRNDNIYITKLDETYVPSYVPIQFVQAVKPFFPKATKICKLWDRARIAFRASRFSPLTSMESFLPQIIQTFKQTIYQYKRNRIRTTFIQYYYGAMAVMFSVEKRKIVAEKTGAPLWLTINK